MITAQPDFCGLKVASLESRRADEMRNLIERHGGVARVSPSMREAPIEQNRAAIEFAHRLLAGGVDAMIFLTGVGANLFVEHVERHVGRERLLASLSDIPTVVRGPKPFATLSKLGIKATHRVPEPNTWRELLTTLDAHLPIANLTVGLQEYGSTNPSLIAGLEARGARVERVRVYDWALPEDIAPLEANARAMVAGEIDVLLVTSATQVEHLRQLAARMNLADELDAAVNKIVIASIGPTSSEKLREIGWGVDIEASHPKMAHLVRDAAAYAFDSVAKKRRVVATLARIEERKLAMATDDANEPWRDSPFLRACRGEPTPYTPVWLMRQAGRYMPEYRAVREKHTFLDLCRNPQLCSEVMCTAVDFLKVDAAIIFSDLLPLLEPLGFELEFSPGDGPVIHNPIREGADVDRVIDLESADSLDFVIETVRATRRDLPSKIPLIGFAGAPFTLASYAIEGGGSRNYLHTKTLMLRDEGAWRTLMQRLARAAAIYLNAQIAAGAQAVQVFDSWVGCLGPYEYRRYVAPYTAQLISELTRGAPVIHFGAGNPDLLGPIAETGGDVIGVDWRISLRDARSRIGERAVQGNLDPATLFADIATIREQARRVLDEAGGAGHVFNLGHGILPQTPPDHARALVEIVHELSSTLR